MNQLSTLKELLQELRLKGMEDALEKTLSLAEKQGHSFLELLYMFLLEEKRHKQESSMRYRLRQAKLPYELTLESFPYKVDVTDHIWPILS
jgi:DNA replication protein DnaC